MLDLALTVNKAKYHEQLYLYSGDICFTEHAAQLKTLLGSCVLITLWHPTLRIGGMCHYLLPTRPNGAKGQDLDGCYGNEAMEYFRRTMENYLTPLSDYEGKIFGESNVVAEGAPVRRNKIGENVEAALEMLHKENIKL